MTSAPATRWRSALGLKWIPLHLAIMALVALMVNFGFWQLRRLDERQLRNQDIERLAFGEPTPVDAVLDEPTFDATANEWTLVALSGRYLYDAELLLMNQTIVGTIGYDVLTPLETTTGAIVVVDRGWVPFNDVLAEPSRPITRWNSSTAEVSIVGWVRPGSQGERSRRDLPPGAGLSADLENVDLDSFTPLLDSAPAPFIVQLRPLTDAVDLTAPPVPQPLPEQGNGSHLGYAMQWFAFALMGAIGWPVLVRSRLKRNALRTQHIVSSDQLDTDALQVDVDTPTRS